jgi:hypothetical protein
MMHTVKVIGIGIALLIGCLVVGRLVGGASQSATLARAALFFIALWAVGAGINMWVGVSKAGYSVSEELPIFFVVFGVPAVVALFAWWRLSRP